jgi:glutathione synthase/RimK-type ligase-like ATP-grasp enzyme
MKRFVISPYKFASESAKALQAEFKALGYECIRLNENSPYKNKPNDFVINWGGSTEKVYSSFNKPPFVALAVNKLDTFNRLNSMGVPTVPSTMDIELVSEWIERGYTAIARTQLNGHSGGGIVIMKSEQDLIEAPLYTLYIKKRNEFRVHVANKKVFFIQEKLRMVGNDFSTDIKSMIRSHKNGWVFCTTFEKLQKDEGNNIYSFVQRLEKTCIDATNALGLDFGAVDIIYNKKHDEFRVLEINTAVGLEGQTLQKYVSMFVAEANKGEVNALL